MKLKLDTKSSSFISLIQYITMPRNFQEKYGIVIIYHDRPIHLCETIPIVSQASKDNSFIISTIIKEQCFIRSIMHAAPDYLGLYHNDVMCTICI